MRLLLNENVSGTVVRELRKRGHDVLSVKASMRSATDEAVLARARAEGRLVVTHDKGFGELAFRYGLPAPCGVILLRLAGMSPESDNRRILDLLSSGLEFQGHFSVVTDDRVRIRPLPAESEGVRNG